MKKTEAQYGAWRSPMRVRDLFAQQSAPAYPFRHRGQLYWLESRAQEGGHLALMRAQNGKAECITPPEFNLRTNAHEYGGKCFCIYDGDIIFNNQSDARLYRQSLEGGTPRALTAPCNDASGFADIIALEKVGAVVAVREHDGGDALVGVDVQGGAAQNGTAHVQTLIDSADFYACPAASPSQTKLAWMQWDDPHMPWDQSCVRAATLHAQDGVLQLQHAHDVFARDEHSVCQVGFFDEQSLFFIADGGGNDFWNFYRARGREVERVTGAHVEFGEAHWQFGQSRWQRFGARIIGVASAPHGDRLTAIDAGTGDVEYLGETFASCAQLCADADGVLFIAGRAARDVEICNLDAQGNIASAQHAPSPPSLDASRPRAITYPTRDGACAHAYFYAPHNRRYRAPPGTLPPLLVLVHGGPTGRANMQWHPLKQYFASLGYAVLDINHRGSCGYGRAYRQMLLGNWGELDAGDIADAVQYALEEKLADANAVFIRGGSAGGYAVLRALTRFPKLFRGGACYYGIGNLITLAQITHRFEGAYTGRLIGARHDESDAHDPNGKFVQRSPIFHIDNIACPLILFQGLEDKVVPPAISREVAAALDAKGIAHEYIEYENEGHGFRHLQTRVDSLQREVAFFAKIMRARNP